MAQRTTEGAGLAARLVKAAYLGSNYEYSFKTELGLIFVVSPELGNVLAIGSDVGLRLAEHGVFVVQVPSSRALGRGMGGIMGR